MGHIGRVVQYLDSVVRLVEERVPAHIVEIVDPPKRRIGIGGIAEPSRIRAQYGRSRHLSTQRPVEPIPRVGCAVAIPVLAVLCQHTGRWLTSIIAYIIARIGELVKRTDRIGRVIALCPRHPGARDFGVEIKVRDRRDRRGRWADARHVDDRHRYRNGSPDIRQIPGRRHDARLSGRIDERVRDPRRFASARSGRRAGPSGRRRQRSVGNVIRAVGRRRRSGRGVLVSADKERALLGQRDTDRRPTAVRSVAVRPDGGLRNIERMSSSSESERAAAERSASLGSAPNSRSVSLIPRPCTPAPRKSASAI